MLTTLFIHAFAIMGIYGLFSDGMLLGYFGNMIRIYAGEFWSKPLVDCPSCMASVWGIIPSLIMFGINPTALVYVISLSGLLYGLSRIGFTE